MDIDKLILKFIWKGKKTQTSQHNAGEGEQSWRNDISGLQNSTELQRSIQYDAGERKDT